jgi:hypothetical protein
LIFEVVALQFSPTSDSYCSKMRMEKGGEKGVEKRPDDFGEMRNFSLRLRTPRARCKAPTRPPVIFAKI